MQHKTLSTTCNNSIQFNKFNISGRKVAISRRLRTLLLQQALQGQTPQQPQQAQVCIKQIGWEKERIKFRAVRKKMFCVFAFFLVVTRSRDMNSLPSPSPKKTSWKLLSFVNLTVNVSSFECSEIHAQNERSSRANCIP